MPEVAKNMSMQESRLIDISEQLQKMLNHYHEIINSVSGADKELLLQNLKKTEDGLWPGKDFNFLPDFMSLRVFSIPKFCLTTKKQWGLFTYLLYV